MKLASLFLACALSAFGALTATSTSCAQGGGALAINFTGVLGGATHGPQPLSCSVVLTGTGTATASTGSADYQWTDGTGTVVSSGLTAGTYYLRPSSPWSSASAGTYTDSTNMVIAGSTMTVVMQIQLRGPLPVFSNANHVADAALSGCTSPTEVSWLSGCVSLNARPGGTFNLPGSINGTYTDAEFGTTLVKYVMPMSVEYVGLNAISPDNTLLISGPGDANSGIYSTSGGGKLYNHPRTFNTTELHCQWVPYLVNAMNYGYCFGYFSGPVDGGDKIYGFHIDPMMGLMDDGVIWTEPHGKAIGDGGAVAPTADGWQGILTDQNGYLYAVKIAYPVTQVVSFDLSTGGVNMDTDPVNNDTPFLAGLDATDHRYHLVIVVDDNLNTYKANRLFSWAAGDTTMTYDGLGPPYPDIPNISRLPGCTAAYSTVAGNCFPFGIHAGAGLMNGTAYLGLPVERYYPNFFGGMVAQRLRDPVVNQARSTYVGGAFNYMTTNCDHKGFAVNGPPFMICMKSDDGAQGNITGPTGAGGWLWEITAATGSNPITLTFGNQDPNLAGSTSMLFGGATGKTGINGVHTMTRIGSTNQYTIAVTDAGTYDVSTGAATKDIALGQTGQEIDVGRMGSNGAIQWQRVVQHQSPIYAFWDTNAVPPARNIGYRSYPFPALSNDGSLMCFTSTGGLPFGSAALTGNVLKTMCAATGISAQTDNMLSINGRTVVVTPHNATADFAVLAPTTAAISIPVSANIDCSSPTDTVTVSGAAYPTPETGTATGLSYPGTYYWCASGTNGTYVAQGSFATTPAIGANGTAAGGRISLGGKIRVGP